MTVESRELPMSPTSSRSVPRSLVCSTLAIALGLLPCLPAVAAAPSKGKSKKAKTEEVEAPKAEEPSVPPPETAPESESEALSAAAVERFEAKDYDGAVELFEKAYATDPNPNYLFNIGRVYEEKGDLEKSVEYYQRFVGQSGVDLESRQAATERLKVLREALAQMKGDEPKDDPQPKEDPSGNEVTGKPGDQIGQSNDQGDDPAKRKKTLRITGYSLMGVGAAGLIVGGVFGGLAQGSVKDADADPFVDRQEAFRERARTQARVADAMFITGGVLAAAGLVLVLTTLGGKKAKGSADVARSVWSPVVGPQHVGLGLSRRF